jgi:hypothetical protein
LHALLGEVTRRVPHMLMRRRDAATGGVIVGPQVRRNAPPACGGDERGNRDSPGAVDDGLRLLDHDLEAQSSSRQPELRLQCVEGVRQRSGVFGDLQFGQGDHEPGGEGAIRGLEHGREEEVERAKGSTSCLFGHRFDADSEERRQDALGTTTAHLACTPQRVLVLFFVRPDAVAVLEVDAKVFDGLGPELVDNARPHLLRELWFEVERARQGRRVRRMLIEGLERALPHAARGVGAE